MTEEEREFFEERAAIMEYCGNMTRKQAEYLAYKELQALQKKMHSLQLCNKGEKDGKECS